MHMYISMHLSWYEYVSMCVCMLVYMYLMCILHEGFPRSPVFIILAFLYQVSRWFGGVLLGPDRFRIISNSARALLTQTGFGSEPIPVSCSSGSSGSSGGGSGSSSHSKKKKQHNSGDR